MKRAKAILQQGLHPPAWALVCIPLLSFSGLAAIFATQSTKTAPAYFFYSMSAYSLMILLLAAPRWIRRAKSAIISSRLMQKAAVSKAVGRYRNDLAFRGNISLCLGAAVNLCFGLFRIITGARYASVWLISLAAYDLALGGLRLYLIVCYRRRAPGTEWRCYRKTAWLLFVLSLPMGGMMVLMVRTNSGFSYPGYLIYLSALYAFYVLTVSIRNLIRFRRLGSPILSAAKVLHLISAMMSILGLQTAMLPRFSSSAESYRRMMNAITGGFVYGAVILLAILMLLRSGKPKKEGHER